MKVFREGLTLALTHRERYQTYINSAPAVNEPEVENDLALIALENEWIFTELVIN